MTTTSHQLSRRESLKRLGVLGAAAAFDVGFVAASPPAARGLDKATASTRLRREIAGHVFQARMIDTHEHLVEEAERLHGPSPPLIPCDDWGLLLSHYLNSDLLVSGMPPSDLFKCFSPKVDPVAKWRLLESWWPSVKHTGYGQALQLTVSELYGVEDLSSATIEKVQAGYEKTRRPGFYRRILREAAGIESCQVNRPTEVPFQLSDMPDLLMQDLSILGMIVGPKIKTYADPAGIEVKSLSDWQRVVKWWFESYAQFAVAVKTQHTYGRDLDHVRVPAEKAEPVFARVLHKEPVSAEDRKLLEDYLFWLAVDEATAHSLPVKIHTGYYAGQNSMPLARLRHNAGSAAELCRLSPHTKFVFMHICYPYYEEILALTKHWRNAYVDMCWSWILNPLAAKEYFKKHLVTAPCNKLLPFGGDYIPVELVLGHAIIARRGIAQALSELVEEGWLKRSDAIELVEPILNGNARKLFLVESKLRAAMTK